MDRKRLLSVILASLSSISSVGAVKAKRNHSNNSKNLISVNQNRSKKTVIKNNKVTKPAKDKKMSSGKESNSLKENKKNENVTKTQGVKNWIKDNPVKSSIGSLAFSALAAYGGLSILEYILTEPDIVYKDLPINHDDYVTGSFRGRNLLFVDDGVGKEQVNQYVSNIVGLFSGKDPLGTYEYGRVYVIPEFYCRFMIVGYNEAMKGKTRCFDKDIVYNTNHLFYMHNKESTVDKKMNFFRKFYKIWDRMGENEWTITSRLSGDDGTKGGHFSATIQKFGLYSDVCMMRSVFFGSEAEHASARGCTCGADNSSHKLECKTEVNLVCACLGGTTMPDISSANDLDYEQFKKTFVDALNLNAPQCKSEAPIYNCKFFKEKWWRELLKAYE